MARDTDQTDRIAQLHPRERAVAIVRTLRDAGFTAYLAGGCVRDELLGLTPQDYDVATDARPEAVQSLFRHTSAVGAAFGVVLVHAKPGTQGGATEVATFREDGAYSDQRRPDEVRFSTPEADAVRRDFTVNALFLDPLASGDGVIDFVGGRADLAARLLRAVGEPERRLAEDNLRALRAVRLACRLGIELDARTGAAIRAHAADLAGVSKERIGDEVRRVLAHPSRGRGVAMLRDLGLDVPVLSLPADDRGVAGVVAALPPQASGLEALVAWAVERHGTAAATNGGTRGDIASAWRRALCLSNTERAGLLGTLEVLGSLLGAWETEPVAARKRRAAGAHFHPATIVLAAIDPDRATAVRADAERLAADGIGLSTVPFVDGEDLIRLGGRPSPVFARVLSELYDRQLDGRVRTKDDGMLAARELLDSSGVQGT